MASVPGPLGGVAVVSRPSGVQSPGLVPVLLGLGVTAARMLWEHDGAGSNPVVPTIFGEVEKPGYSPRRRKPASVSSNLTFPTISRTRQAGCGG